MHEIDFLQVGGFSLGHAQDAQALTGCSVVLFDTAAPSGVAIRGGGPASRETPLLDPLMAASGIHAILLSGGSAFGLDAAGGVMQYLEEQNIGVSVGDVKVPLVCQSSVFDLIIGNSRVRPDATMAMRACQNASKCPTQNGNIGVGMGCTVGKYRGKDSAMKAGFGTYAVQIGDLKLGAMVAVNALGDIFDIATGAQIAGLRTQDGKLCQTEQAMYQDLVQAQSTKEPQKPLFTGNTTIGAIITNAKFSKAELCKIANMAHNGYARAVRPVHTMADGDAIYASSTGDVSADLNIVGTLAATVMATAIARAVQSAQSVDGFISMQDLPTCNA